MKLSVDDGCASDVRVAELAKKYGIETIFYWPAEWHSLAYKKGYEPLTLAAAQGIAREFEIGSHTRTHPLLTEIGDNRAMLEILEGKLILQKLFGIEVKKFCPPRGYITELLKGFALVGHDTIRLTKSPGLVHIHPNSGANNNRPWRECIDENTIEIWGHSHEFDRYNLWDELEEVLRESSHSKL